jgi:hypothetical protein
MGIPELGQSALSIASRAFQRLIAHFRSKTTWAWFPFAG